jgi:hypothetical protein
VPSVTRIYIIETTMNDETLALHALLGLQAGKATATATATATTNTVMAERNTDPDVPRSRGKPFVPPEPTPIRQREKEYVMAEKNTDPAVPRSRGRPFLPPDPNPIRQREREYRREASRKSREKRRQEKLLKELEKEDQIVETLIEESKSSQPGGKRKLMASTSTTANTTSMEKLNVQDVMQKLIEQLVKIGPDVGTQERLLSESRLVQWRVETDSVLNFFGGVTKAKKAYLLKVRSSIFELSNWEDWLIVKRSLIKDAGYGLFAGRDFLKDQSISVYCGRLCKTNAYKSKYQISNDGATSIIAEGCIEDDRRPYLGAHMANDPNDRSKTNCKIESDYRLIVTCDVKKGEELLLSYNLIQP